MTSFVKCDTCGKIQEAQINPIGDPINPINLETGSRWYSRIKDEKLVHACRLEHCNDEAMVWPEWAK